MAVRDETPVFNDKHEIIGFLQVSSIEREYRAFTRTSHQLNPPICGGEPRSVSISTRVDFEWGMVGCSNKLGEVYHAKVLVVRDISEEMLKVLTYVPGFTWFAEAYGTRSTVA